MRSTDFFLPVSTSCTCGRCDVLGCCSSGPVTLCDVAVALEKARVANSQTIVLPQNWIYHPEAQQIGQMIESRKFNTKTQLRWGQGDQFFKNWMRSDKPNVTWILEAADAWMPADFEEIETKCESEYFFLTRRSWDLADKISSLPQGVLAHLQLYTPHFSGSENSNMTVFEIHQLVEDLLQREIAVRPLMGRDIWDPRLDPQLDLEPLGQPRFSTVRESCDITISIVIPSYQNCNHLLATLDHLGTQTLSTQKFEIILVDDGSTDQTEDQVKAWLLQHPEIQLTYLYLPRPAPRAMGDANYRAGVQEILEFDIVEVIFYAFWTLTFWSGLNFYSIY